MADDISYVSLFLVFITVLSASLMGGAITLYARSYYSKRNSEKKNDTTCTEEANNLQPIATETNNINNTHNMTYNNATTSASPSVNNIPIYSPITIPQPPNANLIAPALNYSSLNQLTSENINKPISHTVESAAAPIYCSLPLPPTAPTTPTPTSNDHAQPQQEREFESKKESLERQATFDRLNEEILKFPDQSGSRVTSSSSLSDMSTKSMTLKKENIIIVCYKLPIECRYNSERCSWDIEWNDMRNILSNFRMLRSNEYEVSFVGWPGVSCGNREEEESLEDTLYRAKYRCYPIFVSERQINDCYKVFCRSILWPLFHYKMPAASFGVDYERYWQSYVGLNVLYAQKACLCATDVEENESCMIWFHNYELLLAPQFVRRQIPLAQIGLFVHTTFPHSEVFGSLPTGREILRSILSSDLVGFHTYDYCRHFLSSCKRMLDLDAHPLPEDGMLAVHYLGRDVCLRIGHASILSREIHLMGGSRAVCDARNELQMKNWQNKKMILGIAKLDGVRGAVLTMHAFALFLLSYPEWRDCVSFVLCVSPSTLDDYNDEYVNTLREPIEREIGKLNLKYPQLNLQLINMDSLSYAQLLALYTECDVAIFGTFWDGFNTIPYELTAAQQEAVPPAVILSEYMGCMRSLGGVFRINPWKISQVASTLHSALIMSDRQRCDAHDARFCHVMSYSFIDWAKGLIVDLRKAAKKESNKRVLSIGFGSDLRFIYIRKDLCNLRAIQSKLIAAFKTCKSRILLLDYGGTLTATDDAQMAQKMIRNLIQLCAIPNTIVAIVSGQTREILSRAFGECRSCKNLLICAEKGAYFLYRDEWIKNDKLMNDSEMASWQSIVYRVLTIYTERTNGSYIQRKSTALVWHYRGCDPHFGDMQANEAERYLKRIIDAKKHLKLAVQRFDHGRALEVSPQAIHKGSASLDIISQFLNGDEKMFIMAVGNDRSDEKMFEAVELVNKNIKPSQSFTVKIGIAPTQASYYLNDQQQMSWLLNALNAASHDIIPPMQPLSQAKARRSVNYSNTDSSYDDDDADDADVSNRQGYHGSVFDNITVRSHSYDSLSQLAKINMQNQ